MRQKNQFSFSPEAQKNIDRWLNGSFCDEMTKNTIRDSIETSPEEIENSFYTNLEFGTGGLRGLMGIGPNRMNIYTIRETTQGIANYLLRYYKENMPVNGLSAVIGYDSRCNSREFALESARVFAACGIRPLLFQDISPTPLVSYACRYFKASIAVMVTASHNPPEYNGYKVYWSYGGQVLPPHDQGMMDEVSKVRATGNIVSVSSIQDSKISVIGSEIDDAYLDAIGEESPWSSPLYESTLRPIYSCLHGTGGRLMGRALERAGISDISYVTQQMVPDGSFPTVKQPNPEDPKALKMGIDLLVQNKHDIFIASDPDADRLGAVVLHHGSPVILTGNQIAALMCEWIIRQLYATKKLPERFGIIKSCVTTPLIDAIARKWNAVMSEVLPGFKYIAEKIEEWLQPKEEAPITFLFGAEESYGTLYGLHARDKDAISSGALLCEIASQLKTEGKTLIDALDELYETYGYFFEDLLNIVYEESKEGRFKMKAALDQLRSHPPKTMNGLSVIAWQDLKTGLSEGDPAYHSTSRFPSSNVLIFTLQDATKIIIRPSGTEPKVKVYLFFQSELCNDITRAEVKEKSEKLKVWLLEYCS